MKYSASFLKIIKVLICIIMVLPLCACGSMTARTTDSSTEFVLDTFCTVTASGENCGEIISDTFAAVRRIQDNIDFFSEDSTVAKFNSASANVPIPLDDDTYAIVKRALEISKNSNGALDITIAPVSELWDFKAENPTPPDDLLIRNALKSVGYENLVLDEESKTLTKLIDEVKIDLGACGKGYACEKAIEAIAENYPESYVIIDFGGNIGVYGVNPKHKDGSTTVGIQDPFKETGTYNKTIKLYSGQCAVTSGTYQRHFYYNDKNYHHLLNPKTGYPSESDFESVTIVSDSSLTADCLSTACFILGRGAGDDLAQKYNAQIVWTE